MAEWASHTYDDGGLPASPFPSQTRHQLVGAVQFDLHVLWAPPQLLLHRQLLIILLLQLLQLLTHLHTHIYIYIYTRAVKRFKYLMAINRMVGNSLSWWISNKSQKDGCSKCTVKVIFHYLNTQFTSPSYHLYSTTIRGGLSRIACLSSILDEYKVLIIPLPLRGHKRSLSSRMRKWCPTSTNGAFFLVLYINWVLVRTSLLGLNVCLPWLLFALMKSPLHIFNYEGQGKGVPMATPVFTSLSNL